MLNISNSGDKIFLIGSISTRVSGSKLPSLEQVLPVFCFNIIQDQSLRDTLCIRVALGIPKLGKYFGKIV